MASLVSGLIVVFFGFVHGAVVDQIGSGNGNVVINLNADIMIEKVNNGNLGWKAGRNFHPDISDGYLLGLLGTKRMDYSFLKTKSYSGFTDIPDEFDARKQWPNCPTISSILDQGGCGSCWAFGTTSTFSDRLCIATNGSFTLPLSEDDLNSCYSGSAGCGGGILYGAWTYFASPGVVTGGGYKSNVGCRTYEIPQCDHHVKGRYPPCPKDYSPTPKCEVTCNNPAYETPYSADKHTVDESSIQTYTDNQAVQEDLVKNGPISTAFDVYEDFLNYKSGVYQRHPDAGLLGGHAVRVIGWGTENGTPYWLVANSWNSDWGDDGLFKILRGSDECGIESAMIAGLPLLN